MQPVGNELARQAETLWNEQVGKLAIWACPLQRSALESLLPLS